jgi:hypothetical protein
LRQFMVHGNIANAASANCALTAGPFCERLLFALQKWLP